MEVVAPVFLLAVHRPRKEMHALSRTPFAHLTDLISMRPVASSPRPSSRSMPRCHSRNGPGRDFTSNAAPGRPSAWEILPPARSRRRLTLNGSFAVIDGQRGLEDQASALGFDNLASYLRARCQHDTNRHATQRRAAR